MSHAVRRDQERAGGGDLRFNDHLVEPMVATARAMRPLLERNAQQHEDNGELTQEVLDALDATGILKMAAPERVGGLAISSQGQVRVMAEIAKGCPSTAWVVSIINSVIWLGSAMSFEMQDYLFKDGVPKLCSPTNGTGTLVASGNDFQLNGRWSYGSGCRHSKWALVPATLPSGAMAFVALPLADAKIDYTWKVAGMRGTGSDTVVAEDVLIRPYQLCEIPGVGGTVSLHVSSNGLHPDTRKAQLLEATDYWIGLTLLRSKALGVMVGTVEGLMEQVLRSREKGVMFTTYEHRRDSHVWQAGVGEGYAKLSVVRTILERVTAINDRGALEGRELTSDERIESRSQVIVAIEILTALTEKL
ncbi:MAG: acyl-CoA dehydrogenase family protein, partial [Pirellulaceae bacterium]